MKPIEFADRRRELTLTQRELAAEFDVNTITISNWERGAYPIPRTVALAIECLAFRKRGADADTNF